MVLGLGPRCIAPRCWAEGLTPCTMKVHGPGPLDQDLWSCTKVQVLLVQQKQTLLLHHATAGAWSKGPAPCRHMGTTPSATAMQVPCISRHTRCRYVAPPSVGPQQSCSKALTLAHSARCSDLHQGA